jgi:hypothetical protein
MRGHTGKRPSDEAERTGISAHTASVICTKTTRVLELQLEIACQKSQTDWPRHGSRRLAGLKRTRSLREVCKSESSTRSTLRRICAPVLLEPAKKCTVVVACCWTAEYWLCHERPLGTRRVPVEAGAIARIMPSTARMCRLSCICTGVIRNSSSSSHAGR